MSVRRLLAAVVVALVSALAAPLVSPLAPVAQAHAGNAVEVCCAWGTPLTKDFLTYRISGGEAGAQALVRERVEAWQTATGLRLDEVTRRTKPDIDIRFKGGGGQVQGLARRNFEFLGGNYFVSSVGISISGKAFGTPNTEQQLQIIAGHEFGHALGLGHANFNGDTMSPTVGGGVVNYSACDKEGVQAANQWWFSGAVDPAPPTVNHVHC